MVNKVKDVNCTNSTVTLLKQAIDCFSNKYVFMNELGKAIQIHVKIISIYAKKILQSHNKEKPNTI